MSYYKKSRLIKPDMNFNYEGHNLISEINQLMHLSISARNNCGATREIQLGSLREHEKDEFESSAPNVNFGCECNKEEGESCDLCDDSLNEVCSTEDVLNEANDCSPFKGVAHLLATMKGYDYTSLVEHSYATIGNRPFKLKANRKIKVSDKQVGEIAVDLEELIENHIALNDIRVDEIPEAFNFDTLSDMIEGMESTMLDEMRRENNKALEEGQVAIERVFNRADFMREYTEVIKDTVSFPIGVLWIDDIHLVKERVVEGGGIKTKYVIQSNVERVNPAYCWFTPDYDLSTTGRCVFRLKRYTHEDITAWKEQDIAGSPKLNDNITAFLEQYDEGGYIPHTLLFRDSHPTVDIDYDIMIARGRFKREYIEELGVDIPKYMCKDRYLSCEVHFSGSYILRVRVMNVVDDRLGVYTTVFRRRGNSIFGYSVYDFVMPFAKLYESTLDSIDVSVGKTTGSLIQVDSGVIRNPERYFKRNKSGSIELDISEDNIIEFDSTEAMAAPNFKGFPITVSEVPSNINILIPMLNVILQELERITKIPTMLTDGGNVSSALRTTSNFNAAFAASNKVIQSLLRESENRILKPSIRYIFDVELINGRVSKKLTDLHPEILLSDTLLREQNDDNEGVQNLMAIGQFRDIVPPERFAALLNSVASESLGVEGELIPNAGFLYQTHEPQVQQAP